MTAQQVEAQHVDIVADLDGRKVTVPPVAAWRSSALAALNAGNFDAWAAKTLDDASLAVWDEVDPTVDDIQRFFLSLSNALGVDPGNSAASTRTSRTTRTR